MSAATSKLDNALSEAEGLLDQIKSDMGRLDGQPLDKRRALDVEIERKISSLENLLNKMTADLRSVTQQSSKSFYEGEIKNYRAEHSKVIEELRQKRRAAENDPALRQQQQLANNYEKSNQINNNLDEAIRTGNNTLATGNTIMATLVDDRKHLEHIDSNLDKIDQQAEQGNKTTKDMLRRACCNGVIAWIIVILLAIIFFASLGYKIHKNNNKSK